MLTALRQVHPERSRCPFGLVTGPAKRGIILAAVKGWLSNYHLAVRDDHGEAVVGKTFKGPTDAEFQALTERLLGLERARRGGMNGHSRIRLLR
jgi:hypothetical protein